MSSPGGPNMVRNAKIVRLRRCGMFPWQIAEALAGAYPTLTRMAVIGVCNRAGLADKTGETHRKAAQAAVDARR